MISSVLAVEVQKAVHLYQIIASARGSINKGFHDVVSVKRSYRRISYDQISYTLYSPLHSRSYTRGQSTGKTIVLIYRHISDCCFAVSILHIQILRSKYRCTNTTREPILSQIKFVILRISAQFCSHYRLQSGIGHLTVVTLSLIVKKPCLRLPMHSPNFELRYRLTSLALKVVAVMHSLLHTRTWEEFCKSYSHGDAIN